MSETLLIEKLAKVFNTTPKELDNFLAKHAAELVEMEKQATGIPFIDAALNSGGKVIENSQKALDLSSLVGAGIAAGVGVPLGLAGYAANRHLQGQDAGYTRQQEKINKMKQLRQSLRDEYGITDEEQPTV